jgi:hypothetical protein
MRKVRDQEKLDKAQHTSTKLREHMESHVSEARVSEGKGGGGGKARQGKANR